jgi:4-amino-4-deoxy-L-arabinose transferase-like glycosyltransferase
VRWLVLGAWAVLAVHNVHALPYGVGYDVDGHLQYIEYIVRRGGIPLADQGWQMFQAPLYHLLSAPLYLGFRRLFGPIEAAHALRVVPLLCGALQVELCYRILRRLHPKREELQALGTLLGGLLPINVYLSQNLSNEPLMALFASALVLVALELLHDPEARWRPRTFALLGALLGLAALTKTSAVLLFPALALLVATAALLRFGPRAAPRRALAALALVVAPALLISGWYYARNWWLLGAPFVGGWDEARGYVWWQEPGYRTLGHFTSFGAALRYPVYSAVNGFWDGFYSTLWLDGFAGSAVEFGISPLWNMDFLLAGAWLALLPTAALLLGAAAILATPARSARSGELFALLWLATLVAAMALLALRIASFSTIKASYTLAALAGYAVVGARGFGLLIRGRISRALVSGAMACWALAVVAAYFAR